MVSTLTTTDDVSDDEIDEYEPLPDASALEDRTPDWFKTNRNCCVFALAIGLSFLLLSNFPLWHTDLWGHLAYGRLIARTQSLPATEPLMPLSEGVRMVDTAWLTQLTGFVVATLAGTAGLQALYAGAITGCLGLFLHRGYRKTGSHVLAALGAGLFLWINWQQFHVVRPQLAGSLLFVILFMLKLGRWHRSHLYLIPLMFVLWANSHGSFVVGLGLLGCFWLGSMIDVWRRTGSARMAFASKTARRDLMILQLSAVAALLNPYGLGLYVEVLTFGGSPNLSDLREWDPLTMLTTQGRAAAIVGLMLVFAYRMSPRRVRASEALLLIVFGFAALMTSRFITWWAAPAAWYFMLHVSAIRRTLDWNAEPLEEKGMWSVAAIGLLWIAFALSPLGNRILHKTDLDAHRALSEHTPIDLVKELNQLEPSGQIFNTYEWGDYLLWAGPADVPVFVASHAHLVPGQVWKHYMKVINRAPGWEEILARYGVNTIIVDHRFRDPLIRSLQRNSEWTLKYDDAVGAIFVRREPI